MGHPLKVIQFDSDENGMVEQNNANLGSNLNITLQAPQNYYSDWMHFQLRMIMFGAVHSHVEQVFTM